MLRIPFPATTKVPEAANTMVLVPRVNVPAELSQLPLTVIVLALAVNVPFVPLRYEPTVSE